MGPEASHLGDFLLNWRVRAYVNVFPRLRAFRCVCIPLFSLVKPVDRLVNVVNASILVHFLVS